MAKQTTRRWCELPIGMRGIVLLATFAIPVSGPLIGSFTYAQDNVSDLSSARRNCLDVNHKTDLGKATIGMRVEEEREWNQQLSNRPIRTKIVALRAGGPAEIAGLQAGDFPQWVVDIKTGSGKRITREAALVEELSHYAPGERVQIVVVRDGKERVFEVALDRGDGSLMGGDNIQSSTSIHLDCIRVLWGIELQESIEREISNLSVGKLTEHGAAYSAGLRTGDIIIQLGGDPNPTATKLLDAIRNAKLKRPVLIKYRNSSTTAIVVANVKMQSLDDRNGNSEFVMMERSPGSAKAIRSTTPQTSEDNLETLYQARIMKSGEGTSERKSPYWGKTDEELVHEVTRAVPNTMRDQTINSLLELVHRANKMGPSPSNLRELSTDLIPKIIAQFYEIEANHMWDGSEELIEFVQSRWDQKLRAMLSAVIEHKIRELQNIPTTFEAMGQADLWEQSLVQDLSQFVYPPKGHEYPELSAARTAFDQHRKAALTRLPDGMLFSSASWSLARKNMKHWCTQEAFVDRIHADPGVDENTRFVPNGFSKQFLMEQVIPVVRKECPSAKKITVTNYVKDRPDPVNQYVFSEVDQSFVVQGIDGNPPASTLAEARSIARQHASPCDLQASDPADSEKPRSLPGVADTDVMSEKAIEACLAAVKADPKNRRFKFQLARALLLGGLPNDAVKILTPLAKSGYGGAQAYLAQLFASGIGVRKDVDRAKRLSASAKEKGYDRVSTTQPDTATPLDMSGYRNPRLIRAVYNLEPTLFMSPMNRDIDIDSAYIIHMVDTILAVCPKQFLSVTDDYNALRGRQARGKDPRSLVEPTTFAAEVFKEIGARAKKTTYIPRDVSTMQEMMEGGSADARLMITRQRCEGTALAVFAERSREYLRQVHVP